jgi:hypothetical protein
MGRAWQNWQITRVIHFTAILSGHYLGFFDSLRNPALDIFEEGARVSVI